MESTPIYSYVTGVTLDMPIDFAFGSGLDCSERFCLKAKIAVNAVFTATLKYHQPDTETGT